MAFAILQPLLIPDLQDIALMKAADRVVVQDSEIWSRKGRTHRAVIRTPEGTDYLNIPVESGDKKKEIRKVRINQGKNWVDPILRSLKFNYSNSVYYDFYEPEIASIFNDGKNFEFLTQFSDYLKGRLFEFLEITDEIRPKFLLSSKITDYDSDPDRLQVLMDGGDYYQEHNARHYQRQGKNKSELPFLHPEYRQHFEGFEPFCCVLDLLFQYGPESFRVIDKV
jgi:hypothetical protein